VTPESTANHDLLRLEDIGVRLGGRQILSGVSFTMAPGQFTGLIGPNGAGKTTLLRVILGLQPSTDGRVLLNGSPRSRRGGGLIGYVPQKLSIDSDVPLRARDVVGLGIDGHKLGFPLPSASRRQLVTEALEAVGADAYADSRIGELSGGEQQRVMIAHALIGKPRLLLLDEPLANLDLKSEQGIVSVLARLAHEQGDRHRGVRRLGPCRRREHGRGHPPRGAQRPVRQRRRGAARSRPDPRNRGRRAARAPGAPPHGNRRVRQPR
jgi:zinc/manganese transport system ATP-binding protein